MSFAQSFMDVVNDRELARVEYADLVIGNIAEDIASVDGEVHRLVGVSLHGDRQLTIGWTEGARVAKVSLLIRGKLAGEYQLDCDTDGYTDIGSNSLFTSEPVEGTQIGEGTLARLSDDVYHLMVSYLS